MNQLIVITKIDLDTNFKTNIKVQYKSIRYLYIDFLKL